MLLLVLQWWQESWTSVEWKFTFNVHCRQYLSFKVLEKLYLDSNTISTGSVALNLSIPQFTHQKKLKKTSTYPRLNGFNERRGLNEITTTWLMLSFQKTISRSRIYKARLH